MVDMKLFQGPGFAMNIPTNWFVTASPQFQAIVLAPPEDDDTRANLTVSLRRLEDGATIASLIDTVRQQQQQDYPRYTLLDEIDYTQNGGSGFQQRYTWYNESQQQFITQTQAFFLADPLLFTIIGTTTNQHADKYNSIFATIIDSFRIGRPNPNP